MGTLRPALREGGPPDSPGDSCCEHRGRRPVMPKSGRRVGRHDQARTSRWALQQQKAGRRKHTLVAPIASARALEWRRHPKSISFRESLACPPCLRHHLMNGGGYEGGPRGGFAASGRHPRMGDENRAQPQARVAWSLCARSLVSAKRGCVRASAFCCCRGNRRGCCRWDQHSIVDWGRCTWGGSRQCLRSLAVTRHWFPAVPDGARERDCVADPRGPSRG
jgi:hypothetical protein